MDFKKALNALIRVKNRSTLWKREGCSLLVCGLMKGRLAYERILELLLFLLALKQAEAAFFLLETSVDVGDVSLRLTRSCCFTLSHWQHQWVLSFNKGFGWDQPLTCGASYTCVCVFPFLKAAFMLCSVLLEVSTIPVSPVPTWILDQCYWFKNRFSVKRGSDMDLNQRMFSCPLFLP